MGERRETSPEGSHKIGAARTLAFAALLLALIILATWFGTLLHEALGHCLTYELFGGTAQGFRIDWFGGGMAYGSGLSGSWLPHFIHDFGGMVVNVATGLLALAWLLFRRPRTTLRLGIVLFVLISVLSQTGYACIGFYYDIGDPSGWAARVPTVGRIVWLPFLIAAPFVAYVLMKPYVRLQQQMFPIVSPFRRVLFAVLTLGTAVAAFATLHIVTSALHRVEFPAAAQAQSVERVRVAKTEAVREELRQEYPEAEESVIEERVERTPIIVEPEEAHVGPWVALAYAAFMIAGGLAALWRGVSNPGDPLAWPGRRSLVVSWLVVAVGLAILWVCGNEFPWPHFD